MKNKILLVTIISVFFAASSILFYSCTKEEPIFENVSVKAAPDADIPADDIPDISFEEIDAMAVEAANFHTFAVERFLRERYDGASGDMHEEYYNEMFEYTNHLAREYPFERIGRPEEVEPMPYRSFNRLAEMVQSNSVKETMMGMIHSEGIDHSMADMELVSDICDQITMNAEELVLNSEGIRTFDQFRATYYRMANMLLMPYRVRAHFHTYVMVKFYVEIYISSFHTWCYHFVYPKWGKDPILFWDGVRVFFPRIRYIVRTDAIAFPIGYVWYWHCYRPWWCSLHRGVVWCVLKSIVISRVIWI
jgi:hypothetical protein